MKIFTFNAETRISRPLEEVFPFFSEAQNLETLTPLWLKFEVLTPTPITMHAGRLIDYRIKFRGFPMSWRTEIAEWDPPHRFVDVQLKGPYLLWHHTHTFTEEGGDTVCRDEVKYHPRGGALTNFLFVRRNVERIFRYRQKRMHEIFKPVV